MKKRVLILPPSRLNIETGCGLNSVDLSFLNKKNCATQKYLLPPYFFPPHDLMLLGAIAEQAGCEVKIADYNLTQDLKKDLSTFQPHYIVAHVGMSSFKADMNTLQFIKLAIPNVKIIVKGEIFLTHNINAIYEKTFLDYVIVGEAEITLKEILEGVPDEEITGICYRKNFQGTKTAPRIPLENLDELPFPARNLINNNIYNNRNNQKYTIIELSRGCQSNCFNCLKPLQYGDKIRTRSVDNIIKELKECIDKYDINNFVFKTEILDFDKIQLAQLCKQIIDNKLHIKWEITLIPHNITNELAKLMHNSGCQIIYLPIESGSPTILKNLKKNYDLEQIINGVKILHKSKIKTMGIFAIGYPWETEVSANETIEFAQKLDCEFIKFYPPAPYPGSMFYAFAMQTKLFDITTSYEAALDQPIIRSLRLTKDKLSKLIKMGYKRFYLRPQKIFETFKQLNFKEQKIYFNYILSNFLNK